MAAIYDEFIKFVRVLNADGVDYAVCGGWALTIHGFPRATFDIDLLILADDLDRIWSLARGLGYDIAGSPMSFKNGTVEIRRISKIDPDTKELITVDFLLVTAELKAIWEDREVMETEDANVSIVSLDGLIALKTISGRTKDLLDLETIRNGN
jgi:hypothetical protein